MTVLHGDCLSVLPTLAADSFDSCVTDPPYHLTSIVKRFGKAALLDDTQTSSRSRDGADGMARLARGFMGKTWDGGDIAMRPETWAPVLRVLKPGAHLVAFGGSRTHHRIWCAIEDAGFEIRDTIMWLYGSGFPKSHNLDGDWEGWGTALKPAFEPIILARKPLAGTVATNMAAHGTGALNIDGGRVGAGPAYTDRPGHKAVGGIMNAVKEIRITSGGDGRWPANVIHDGSDEVLAAFPDAPGLQGDLVGHNKSRKSQSLGDFGPAADHKARRDSGSASRFFYCAKASKADREEGCENLPARPSGMVSETSGQHITRRDGGAPGPSRNSHPTVKPTALMRYLVRLVTPPGGTVLDPFTGSGSTGKAAVLEGFNFLGIEREDEYTPIAEARIAAAIRQRYDEVFGE